jgi:hypothetical protein
MNIHSATYGGKDCTSQIQSLVVNDRLVVRANNDIIGDPCVNVVKHLNITYEDHEGIKNISVNEGSYVSIPDSKHTRLGIFYTNNDNAKISTSITESLKSIHKSAIGKADIITSVWHHIHDNPFNQYQAWTRTSSHLNQLLQIMQLLFIARSTGKYEYVSFLEHDVLYPEGYFDYPDFETGKILTNMNYGGICKDGWQRRKQDDEPFHQMTMRFDDAIKHCMDILPNAVQHNSGLIEPQTMNRIQWESLNEAIHINHGYHFTSHNSIYDSVKVEEAHTYWGSHTKYSYLFS